MAPSLYEEQPSLTASRITRITLFVSNVRVSNEYPSQLSARAERSNIGLALETRFGLPLIKSMHSPIESSATSAKATYEMQNAVRVFVLHYSILYSYVCDVSCAIYCYSSAQKVDAVQHLVASVRRGQRNGTQRNATERNGQGEGGEGECAYLPPDSARGTFLSTGLMLEAKAKRDIVEFSVQCSCAQFTREVGSEDEEEEEEEEHTTCPSGRCT